MDHRPESKAQNYKIPEDNIRENLEDLGYSDAFLFLFLNYYYF